MAMPVLNLAVAPIARILGTVAWGALVHVTLGGHFAKRAAYAAAIITGGTVAAVADKYATLSVAPLRAEWAYARNGDVSYFLGKDRKTLAPWASPLRGTGTTGPAMLAATVTDAMLRDAALRNIRVTPSDVSHMCATFSLAAVKRNVSPVPVWTDAEVTGTVLPYNATRDGKAYAATGHGDVPFALPASYKPATARKPRKAATVATPAPVEVTASDLSSDLSAPAATA